MRIEAALKATDGNTGRDLYPAEAQWLAEYEAVAAFGWTHQQYLDTPHEATQWLLRIHHKVEKVKADKRADAERQGGRG